MPAGQAREQAEGKPNPWMVSFRLLADSVAIGAPLFTHGDLPSRMGFGTARGMVGHDGYVVLDHRLPGTTGALDSDRRLVEWRCGEEKPHVRGANLLFEKFDGGQQERIAPGGAQRSLSMSVPWGAARPLGIGVAGSAVLFFDDVNERPRSDGSKPVRTQITAVDDTERYRYAVAAGLRPMDSRPGVGILFTETEPYPHVFVITEQELLGALRFSR